MPTFAPPPLGTPLVRSDLTGPAWARWLQQLWDTIRGESWTVIGASDFKNGWVNFDPATKQTAAFMKDSAGFAHMKGLIKSGTVGLKCLTLPVGYRPALRAHFATVSNDAFGYFYVDPNGDVVPLIGSNVYFSLDSGIFRAEN